MEVKFLHFTQSVCDKITQPREGGGKRERFKTSINKPTCNSKNNVQETHRKAIKRKQE